MNTIFHHEGNEINSVIAPPYQTKFPYYWANTSVLKMFKSVNLDIFFQQKLENQQEYIFRIQVCIIEIHVIHGRVASILTKSYKFTTNSKFSQRITLFGTKIKQSIFLKFVKRKILRYWEFHKLRGSRRHTYLLIQFLRMWFKICDKNCDSNFHAK